MQRQSFVWLLGLSLVGGIAGCAREPEPKYVMPDVEPIDVTRLKLATPGGPAPKEDTKKSTPKPSKETEKEKVEKEPGDAAGKLR